MLAFSHCFIQSCNHYILFDVHVKCTKCEQNCRVPYNCIKVQVQQQNYPTSSDIEPMESIIIFNTRKYFLSIQQIRFVTSKFLNILHMILYHVILYKQPYCVTYFQVVTLYCNFNQTPLTIAVLHCCFKWRHDQMGSIYVNRQLDGHKITRHLHLLTFRQADCQTLTVSSSFE